MPLLIFLIPFLSLFNDQYYEGVRIHVVQSVSEIDQARSQEILVKSFMDVYEDVPLVDLNPEFKSTGDMRRFYQDYFKEEFGHFQEGHIYWVEAYLNDRLAGWATFELEGNNEAYMNLLTVDPDYQGKGLGRYLTFSICSEEMFPHVEAINLLVRKVNEEGYKFYHKIGFFESDYQRSDNFVGTKLLAGLRWEKQ